MGGFNTSQFNTSPGGGGTSPGTATLNSTLLYAALRKAGVQITPRRGPGVSQLADAIDEENRMVSGWRIATLLIASERIDLVNTVGQQQSYTIGKDPTGTLTADWDLDRPNKIVRANLLLPTATDPIQKVRRPISIWDAQQWAAIQFQAVYSYPEGLFPLFVDTQTSPAFMRAYLKPIPDAAYQIELYSWQRIPQFVSAADIVILPDGFEDAVVNNLAVRLASYPWTFQRPMDPQVRVDAINSLALIQQFNATPPRLLTEGELRSSSGYYNYKTGLIE